MTMVGPVGVGIIGAGMISEFYLENLTRFPDTNGLAIAGHRSCPVLKHRRISGGCRTREQQRTGTFGQEDRTL